MRALRQYLNTGTLVIALISSLCAAGAATFGAGRALESRDARISQCETEIRDLKGEYKDLALRIEGKLGVVVEKLSSMDSRSARMEGILEQHLTNDKVLRPSDILDSGVR